MSVWSESTIARLRSSVFQTLTQAGYIENTSTWKLQPVYLATEVLKYLREQDERYVLRCLQIGP